MATKAPNGKPKTGGSAKAILDRLATLESQQEEMMVGIRSSHASEMDSLRERLARAEQMRRQVAAREVAPAPVLMSVDMAEIDAAVHAAHVAAERSDNDLQDLLAVALDARGGGVPTIEAPPGAMADPGSGEYLVKRVSVNLDDVERVINSSDLVEVCRAFGRPDSKYGNEVFCAVVPKRGVRVNEPMITNYAQQYLPTAMVPKRFFFLEHLPSGITRKALAATQEIRDLTNQSDVKAIDNAPYEEIQYDNARA